jgi:hypothetical protein
LVGQAIDSRIFAILKAIQQVRIGGEGQVAQDLRQVGRADLAGSARAVGKGG